MFDFGGFIDKDAFIIGKANKSFFPSPGADLRRDPVGRFFITSKCYHQISSPCLLNWFSVVKTNLPKHEGRRPLSVVSTQYVLPQPRTSGTGNGNVANRGPQGEGIERDGRALCTNLRIRGTVGLDRKKKS